MTQALKQYDSPVGEFEWVFIDGEGKKNLQNKQEYTVDLVLDADAAEQAKADIQEFWEDNKPKGAKEPKSLGFYPHRVRNPEWDGEDPDTKWLETGKTVLRFKTGTAYPNGDQKIIKIFNAKGNEVSLQGKKIGNGSRGRVSGAMDIYDINAASRGVTLYLNGVQLSKFVEYTGGVNFSEMEDEDGDGFEGVPGGMGGIEDETNETTERPRL